VDKLCALIKDHNIIHFFGKGFNSYTGADFSFKFSRFGKYVRVISEEKSILMSAEFAREGEMILVASLRGIDNNLLEAMTITKEKNIPIALI
ncbi:SIS domain-containing protein, partial [Bifidobacterium pseudocatenulatum]|nr:SIS domain-containing protein [Bifidobacterium pseudocatenulatum]